MSTPPKAQQTMDGTFQGNAALVKSFFSSAEIEARMATFLPVKMSTKRFISLVLAAVAKNPKLAQCTKLSFLEAVRVAAELGLEPNSALGHGWLIPFKAECVFIPGYRGFVHLAHRMDLISWCDAQAVYQGEPFRLRFGTEPGIDHTPDYDVERTEETLIGAYAVVKQRDGEKPFRFLPRKRILEIRARSKSFQNGDGPWFTDFEEMVMKTATRGLMKRLPLANESWSRLLEADNRDTDTEGERTIRQGGLRSLSTGQRIIEGQPAPEAPPSSPQGPQEEPPPAAEGVPAGQGRGAGGKTPAPAAAPRGAQPAPPPGPSGELSLRERKLQAIKVLVADCNALGDKVSVEMDFLAKAEEGQLLDLIASLEDHRGELQKRRDAEVIAQGRKSQK